MFSEFLSGNRAHFTILKSLGIPADQNLYTEVYLFCLQRSVRFNYMINSVYG